MAVLAVTAAACGSSSDAVPVPTAAAAPTLPPVTTAVAPTTPPPVTTSPPPTLASTTTVAPTTTAAPPPPTTVPAPTTTEVLFLRAGDEGPEVAEFQALLEAADFLEPGYTSGVFDRATNDAVLDFQGQYGLIVDGVVGPETMRALRAAAAS